MPFGGYAAWMFIGGKCRVVQRAIQGTSVALADAVERIQCF